MSLRDKRLFEIIDVEITRVNCIFSTEMCIKFTRAGCILLTKIVGGAII